MLWLLLLKNSLILRRYMNYTHALCNQGDDNNILFNIYYVASLVLQFSGWLYLLGCKACNMSTAFVTTACISEHQHAVRLSMQTNEAQCHLGSFVLRSQFCFLVIDQVTDI